MRLFVDWDGTVTVRDSLVQVIHEFGDPALLAELEPRVGVDLTLHEEIAAEFAAVTAPLDEVVAWVLDHVEVRPGLPELAALGPTIVSAGFRQLIEPVLRREGIELPVLANDVEARRDGWVVRWRDEAVCATCGEPCKRGGLAGGRTSTSATATPTAVRRSPPTASSHATRLRGTWTSGVPRTSRSTT
jgi:2-hydroxy-3-keto-5-methylthiopentenyl-1-phosphate phosphatase